MAGQEYRQNTRGRDESARYRDRQRPGSIFRGWDDDRLQSRREREQMRRDERFHNRDSHRDVAINETRRLIASDKVEGTPVYGRDGERLGSIYNLMIDKRSGRVEYAVMTSGGFLGMGADYVPVPWEMLSYDTDEDGYVVDMTRDELDRAPSFRRGQEPSFNRDYKIYIYRWYGL